MEINPKFTSGRTSLIALLLTLAALTAIPFLPSIPAPFSIVDDYRYIVENPLIQNFTLSNLWTILTKPYFNNYLPLHLLTYAVDHLLWGNNPAGYRIENIVWHIGSVWVLFFILRRFFGRIDAAIFGALFFGVHPACIESVAWIAERKNVMSQFFGLLSFWFYMTRKEGRRRYLWSIIACAATLLSKTSWVVLPILLVVYQWMIEGERNWKKLSLDKLPYFALVFLAGLATLYSQKLNPEIYKFAGEGPLETALAEAVVWARYVRMTLWPVGLSVSYEVKKWGVAPVSIIAAVSLIALIIATLIYPSGSPDKKARSWSPLRMGILWFFIALLPVSNIIPLPVALKNRYLYLPLIGAAAFTGQLLLPVFNSRVRLGRVLAVTTILCLMAITAQRSHLWRDSLVTWSEAVRLAPDNAEPHFTLDKVHSLADRTDRAILHFGIGAALSKGLPADRFSVARHYLDWDMPEEALNVANKMRRTYPDDPHLLTTCGCALLQLGKMGNAERALQMAVRQNSRDAMTYVCLSIIASTRGEKYETLKLLERAVELDPENAHANLKLAVMLEQSAPEKALYHFQKVLEIEPNHPDRERIKEAIKRLGE